MTDDPHALLTELSDLRKRARQDRHGYWFPLLLFGVLTFLSIPLYEAKEIPESSDGTGVSVDTGVGWQLFGTYVDPFGAFYPFMDPVKHPLAFGLYWSAVLVLGFVATVWWYRWRAQRTGVETPTSSYVWATAMALAVPWAGLPILWLVTSRWNIGLTLMDLLLPIAGVLLASVVVVIAARNRVVTWVCAPLVFLSATLLVGFSFGGHGQFLAIAVGLLALAWVERSTLFGVIAAVFTASALVTLMEDVHWTIGLPDFVGGAVLLPGIVLVLGGAAGLIAERKVSHV